MIESGTLEEIFKSALEDRGIYNYNLSRIHFISLGIEILGKNFLFLGKSNKGNIYKGSDQLGDWLIERTMIFNKDFCRCKECNIIDQEVTVPCKCGLEKEIFCPKCGSFHSNQLLSDENCLHQYWRRDYYINIFDATTLEVKHYNVFSENTCKRF